MTSSWNSNFFPFFFSLSLALPPTACKHKARAATFTAETRRRRSRQSTEPRLVLVPVLRLWNRHVAELGRGGVGGGVRGGAKAHKGGHTKERDSAPPLLEQEEEQEEELRQSNKLN